MKYIPETRHIFRCASDLGIRIIRKSRIPCARVCLFAGNAVNNIVNNGKNHDQRSKLYFKMLKTWKNWESTLITSTHSHFWGLHFPFPVAKSQSQKPKSHFPSLKIDQSQFPFYPFRTLYTACIKKGNLYLTCYPASINKSIGFLSHIHKDPAFSCQMTPLWNNCHTIQWIPIFPPIFQHANVVVSYLGNASFQCCKVF